MTGTSRTYVENYSTRRKIWFLNRMVLRHERHSSILRQPLVKQKKSVLGTYNATRTLNIRQPLLLPVSPNNSLLSGDSNIMAISCIWQSNIGSSRNNACEPLIFTSPTRSIESFTRSDRLLAHAELCFEYEWSNFCCIFERFATGAAGDRASCVGR